MPAIRETVQEYRPPTTHPFQAKPQHLWTMSDQVGIGGNRKPRTVPPRPPLDPDKPWEGHDGQTGIIIHPKGKEVPHDKKTTINNPHAKDN